MTTNHQAETALSQEKPAADLEAGDLADSRVFPNGCDSLFSRDNLHDLFLEMVKTEISNILSNPDTNNSTMLPDAQLKGTTLSKANSQSTRFTADDRTLLRHVAEIQMKRALNAKIKEQREADEGIYTLLGRESIEAIRAINQAVVTIAALGAGFTFTVIFSDPAQPPNKAFTSARVKLSIAVAWLLFVVAMSLASYATVLQAMREQTVGVKYGWRVAQGLILAGALCASAEAVRAYESAVGITAFVLIPSVTVGWMVWSNRYRFGNWVRTKFQDGK